MNEIYPQIEPFNTRQLEIDKVHKIYVEECGNPNGIPVIYLHGGPGSGCSENHRRYFNPAHYRIVIFDQRGTARSTPSACIKDNTTHHLIGDIESIRETLGIERWLIFGGSWGATLGLLYAEAFPDRISGMILRGTFLARQSDLDWFAKTGASKLLPDYWQDFIQFIPESEHDDLIAAYYKRIHGEKIEEMHAAVHAWNQWSGRLVTYSLTDDFVTDEEDMDKTIREVTIETHYAYHRYFIEENQILLNIDLLPNVPIMIIHGRRDLTCPMDSSWSLHKAIPGSELIIVNGAGHLAGEPAMVDALIDATNTMAEGLS